MWVKIKKNKMTTQPYHFIVLDSECFPIDSRIIKRTKEHKQIDFFKHELSFGYAFYNVKRNGKYERVDEIYFTSSIELTKWILSKVILGKTLNVFAHNMGYDFRTCIDVNTILNNGYILKFAVTDNNFIMRYSKFSSGKYFCINFLSSTNYARTKLSEIGKIFGYPKIDFKFDEIGFQKIIARTDEVKKYCFRDVEILELFIKSLIDFMKNNCKFSFTVASMAFNIFRHKHYKENITMHKLPNIEEFERNSYFGGRVECFRIGKFKNIYKLDINSMYPYVMKNNAFPVKLIKTDDNVSIDFLKNTMKNFGVIAHVRVKIDEPKIPYRANKLIFPIGEFETWLCSPELNLLKNNEILEIKKLLIYELDNTFFKSFVDEYYNKRLEYKNSGNDVMQYFSKIVLNSLYGKFAQKKKREIKKEEFNGKLINGYADVQHPKFKTIHHCKFLNGECFEIQQFESGHNTFIPISAFVTSYARSYLWELISLCYDDLYYVDTDSLFVNKNGLKKLEKYLDTNELGKLKIEEYIKDLHLRDNKDYSYDENHKVKGVKSEFVINGLQNKFEYRRFLGFNESLRYYNLAIGEIIDKKELKRNYNKGKVIYDKVYPYHIPHDHELIEKI